MPACSLESKVKDVCKLLPLSLQSRGQGLFFWCVSFLEDDIPPRQG
jgi:hypothetical protein